MEKSEIDIKDPDPEVIKSIEENVKIVIKIISRELDVNLSFDESSVKWIEGYINRTRESINEDTKDRLVHVLGAYLGEAIINSYGGKWVMCDGSLGVHIKDDSFVFPFSKVQKHIFDGPEDTVYSFFKLIPELINLNKDKTSKK